MSSNVSENQALLFNPEFLDFRWVLAHPLHNGSDHPSPLSDLRTTFQYVPHDSAETSLTNDVTALFIVKIVESLMDIDLSDDYWKLKKELKLLTQILTLARLAIQAYGHILLGSSVATIFDRRVERCNARHNQVLSAEP